MTTDWTSFYFDGHNRANTSETTLNNTSGSPNNIANLTLKWKTSVGFTSGTSASACRNAPVASGAYVIVGSDSGKVYSLARSDGTQRWATTLGSGPAIRTSCAVSGGQVFVGANDGKLYALDETTGAVNWSFTSGGSAIVSSPAVSGGNVLFSDNAGHLYSVPTGGGAANWTQTTVTSAPSGSAIAIYNSLGWVARGPSVTSFNLSTGAVTRTFTSRDTINSPLCIANDGTLTHLIFGGNDRTLYDYNADTGALIWSDRQSGVIYAGTAIDTVNGYCFAGTHNWSCEAHNLNTGKLRWKKDGGSGSGIDSAAILITGVSLPNAPSDTGNGLLFWHYPYQDGRLVGFASTNTPGGHNPLVKYPSSFAGGSVTGATWSSSVSTYTCSGHGFSTGDQVQISSVNPSGYNGNYDVTGTTTNTFTVAHTSSIGTKTGNGKCGRPDSYSSPIVADQRVYFASDSGYMFCLGI